MFKEVLTQVARSVKWSGNKNQSLESLVNFCPFFNAALTTCNSTSCKLQKLYFISYNEAENEETAWGRKINPRLLGAFHLSASTPLMVAHGGTSDRPFSASVTATASGPEKWTSRSLAKENISKLSSGKAKPVRVREVRRGDRWMLR